MVYTCSTDLANEKRRNGIITTREHMIALNPTDKMNIYDNADYFGDLYAIISQNHLERIHYSQSIDNFYSAIHNLDTSIKIHKDDAVFFYFQKKHHI